MNTAENKLTRTNFLRKCCYFDVFARLKSELLPLFTYSDIRVALMFRGMSKFKRIFGVTNFLVINIFYLKGKKTTLPPTGTPIMIQIMHVAISSQSTHSQSFEKKNSMHLHLICKNQKTSKIEQMCEKCEGLFVTYVLIQLNLSWLFKTDSFINNIYDTMLIKQNLISRFLLFLTRNLCYKRPYCC